MIRRAARSARAAVRGPLGAAVIAVIVLVPVVVGLLAAAVVSTTKAALCQALDKQPLPAVVARTRIPSNYLALYQRAGQEYGVPWAVLAGIGEVETNHGRLDAPGVSSGVNTYGCCAGPMQFNLHDGPPSTWDRYGIDGNGDGVRDIYDPQDAIPSAANYLKTLLRDAGGVVPAAVRGYNHSWVYVGQVMGWAAFYTGKPILDIVSPVSGAVSALGAEQERLCAQPAGLDAGVGPANVRSAVRRTAGGAYRTLPTWAMAGSRKPQQVDGRIYDDVVWLLRRYHIAVTAAREDGHHTHGDGTALDLVPADGSTQAIWDASTGLAARDLGWTPSCASSGSKRLCDLVPAIHWIGYDGYPGHGSPRTCRWYNRCYAHLHISWDSPCYGTGTPAPPCSSVMAFPAPLNPIELST